MNPVTRQQFEALSVLIQKAMRKFHVPGVAVGLMCGDQQRTAAFGVTSIENPLPVTPETLFQIGSISKTFTATLIMMLAEEGKLDLDQPAKTYLPELKLADKSVTRRVTLRQLLTHVGGWMGDFFDDFGDGDDALARYVAACVDLPQITPLGSVYSYNNTAFAIAGRVVEVASGQSYEQVVQTRLFDPLGMQRAFVFPADVMTYRFATGHQVDGTKNRVARPWPIGRAGTCVGGIVTNVTDLLAYAHFQMGDGRAPGGRRLLKKRTLAMMRSPQVMVGVPITAMGLSWMLDEVDGVWMVEHGGATNGQTAQLAMIPEEQFALVSLTNSDYGRWLNRAVVQWMLRRVFGLRAADAVEVRRPANDLREYVGLYRWPTGDLSLRLEKGRLIAYDRPKGGFPKKDSPPPPADPPMRLAFSGEDRVFYADGPAKGQPGQFLRDPDGAIAYFRIGGRTVPRV